MDFQASSIILQSTKPEPIVWLLESGKRQPENENNLPLSLFRLVGRPWNQSGFSSTHAEPVILNGTLTEGLRKMADPEDGHSMHLPLVRFFGDSGQLGQLTGDWSSLVDVCEEIGKPLILALCPIDLDWNALLGLLQKAPRIRIRDTILANPLVKSNFQGDFLDFWIQYHESHQEKRWMEETLKLLELEKQGIVFRCRMDGIIENISPLIEKFGFQANLEGTPYSRFVHPDDFTRLADAFSEVWTSEQSSLTFRVCNDKGEVFPVRSCARLVRDEEGEDRLVGIMRLISEELDLSSRLDHVQRLGTLLQRVSGVLFGAASAADLAGNICRILVEESPFSLAMVLDREQPGQALGAWSRTRRLDCREVLSREYLEFLGTLPLTGTCMFHSVIQDPRFKQFSAHLVRHRLSSLLMVPLAHPDRPFSGILCVHGDLPGTFDPEEVRLLEETALLLTHGLLAIDHRVESEKARTSLESSETRYRALFEHSLDGIFIETVDGTILECNESACRMHGFSKEEMLRLSAYQLVSEKTLERFPTIIDEEISKGGFFVEAEGKRKDGSLFPTEVHSRLFSLDGQDRVVVSVRDITERKQREQKRWIVEKRLRHSQRIESLSLLASKLAHDFNNLLMGILGNASLSLMEIPRDHPVATNLQDIERSAEEAASLARTLLSYAGGWKPRFEETGLADIIASQAELFQAVLPERIHLVYRVDPNLPTIRVDPEQCAVLLSNLCHNAVDAIGDGTGMITISASRCDQPAEDPQFELLSMDATPSGPLVCLEIADSGNGMDPELLEKIFEPCFSTRNNASGMGLVAVAGIVRNHQAILQVRSLPGQGAVFRVYFPAT